LYKGGKKMAKNKKKKGSWVVKVECTVVKELICNNCTKEQVEDDPWAFCIDERELEVPDWEVQSVTENV
jgi:hypothetical protein